MTYRTLLALALAAPLALGDFSYDYKAPTAAPTTETASPTTAPTTETASPSAQPSMSPTLPSCPILEAPSTTDDDNAQCPGGEITTELPPCTDTGLQKGDLCYLFVPSVVVVGRHLQDEPECPGLEEPESDCKYSGPRDGEELRRRLDDTGGTYKVFVAVGNSAAPSMMPTVTDVPTTATAAPTAMPTDAPTMTGAPTRADTYAPTRMTEAPSYAPTTDTYAPTYAGCPPLGVLEVCPVDAVGLPSCTATGLVPGDLCTTNITICTDAPRINKCSVASIPPPPRRLRDKQHGPVTRAFHGWVQRNFKSPDLDVSRRQLQEDVALPVTMAQHAR